MGNIGSNNSNNSRRHGGRTNRNHYNHPPTPPPYYQYSPLTYYPPPPPRPAVPRRHYHQYPPVMQPPASYIDHQKTVTIKNDVNLKKETLKIEADELNPGMFLVSFTFDSTVACSMTLYFFAKEGEDCNLTTTKESLIPPITVTFQQGLGQKFRQAPGTGIDLSTYEESEFLKGNELTVYPLVVKAEATPRISEDGKRIPVVTNSQITDAVFEKVKGEYKVRVVKQMLWANGISYEMLEIYGIGNSADANDPGKECVICLSERRDTTVLPCRHMCMCNGCAKVLRFQTNRCPICRQPVERLLKMKVNNGTGDWVPSLENTRKPNEENGYRANRGTQKVK